MLLLEGVIRVVLKSSQQRFPCHSSAKCELEMHIKWSWVLTTSNTRDSFHRVRSSEAGTTTTTTTTFLFNIYLSTGRGSRRRTDASKVLERLIRRSSTEKRSSDWCHTSCEVVDDKWFCLRKNGILSSHGACLVLLLLARSLLYKSLLHYWMWVAVPPSRRSPNDLSYWFTRSLSPSDVQSTSLC